MKRNLIIIVISFLIIIALMITGDVITIGEKLNQLTGCRYVEYGFYLLLVSLLCGYIIIPILRVHRAPQIPNLSIEADWDANALVDFANKLAKNADYIPDRTKRKMHVENFSRDISGCICDSRECD